MNRDSIVASARLFCAVAVVAVQEDDFSARACISLTKQNLSKSRDDVGISLLSNLTFGPHLVHGEIRLSVGISTCNLVKLSTFCARGIIKP